MEKNDFLSLSSSCTASLEPEALKAAFIESKIPLILISASYADTAVIKFELSRVNYYHDVRSWILGKSPNGPTSPSHLVGCVLAMAESQKQEETADESTEEDTLATAEKVYESVRQTLQALDDLESRWKVSEQLIYRLWI